jgi:hypothetical protein
MTNCKIEKTTSEGYSEIYEVNYPVRFFFVGNKFDGIDIGPIEKEANKKDIELAIELNKKLDKIISRK